MKIYVAGHTGLVGSSLVRRIQEDQIYSWIGKTRSELDLLDRSAVFDYIHEEKPDAVIIAAAKVGGIGANSRFPVDFLSENLRIETNLIDGSHSAGVPKLVFLGSSCIYPKYSRQPIKEEYLLTGELEETNEAYAISKIAGLKLIESYRKQYGHNWISVMPTNLYGPEDNFDLETSHVIPALIHKFHSAKIYEKREVTLWGSGSALREFLYVDDLADAILFLLSSYSGSTALNIGYGSDISIKDLALLIKDEIGYQGEVLWDSTKPDGTPRKFLDSERLRSLGWAPKVDLSQGIKSTYSWFKNEYRKTIPIDSRKD